MQQIYDWLDKPINPLEIPEEFRDLLDRNFDLEELKKDLETYSKVLLIEHIISDLSTRDDDEDDF